MQNENQGLVNHDFFGEKQVECHRRKKHNRCAISIFHSLTVIGHENYQTANRQQNKPHQLLNNQLLVIAFRLSSLTPVTL